MKRILATILILMLIPLSGCSQDNQKEEMLCSDCGESCSAYFYFCPNCGARLTTYNEGAEVEADSESFDYSNFNFNNIYGEWLNIIGYNFSDIENAYIQCFKYHKVFLFQNNYLQIYDFEGSNLYSGDAAKGELHTAINYNVASNSVLSLADNSSYSITDITMNKSIPIINIEHKLFDGGRTFPDGNFIPAHFIDFSKTPEITDYGYVKFFIKAEYLK